MVTPLGPGSVVGQIARWDGINWVAATPRLDLVAESIDPTAAASLPITGLNGDADLIYFVLARLVKASTNGNLGLRLNNDSGANYRSVVYAFGAGTGPSTNNGASFIWMSSTDSSQKVVPGFITLYGYIFTKTGANRRAHVNAGYPSAGGGTPVIEGMLTLGEWTNTVDNLTELDFLVDAGTIGGSGTFIRVYKVSD